MMTKSSSGAHLKHGGDFADDDDDDDDDGGGGLLGPQRRNAQPGCEPAAPENNG